jgi:hypothetical protein
MSVTADHGTAVSAGWLRGRGFDLLLLGGLSGLALAAAALISAVPAALAPIFLADTWLLGYPHVIATFTRIAGDRASIRAHRFLLFGLPPLVLAVTAALAFGLGVWSIATIYFYWQWYHTVRQSWGVAQLYRRKSGVPVAEPAFSSEFLFYLIPAWGLLHRLTLPQDHFLMPSLHLVVPLVPVWLANGVGAAAVLGLAWWGVERLREAWTGRLALLHALFSASHFAIFIVGYVVMDDLAAGFVVTNIWHTGQYLMLVWLFNQNKADREPQARRSAYGLLSLGNRVPAYFLLCFAAAFPLYLSINSIYAEGTEIAIVFGLMATQTLNFHHFIVDSVIWRRRRAAVPA